MKREVDLFLAARFCFYLPPRDMEHSALEELAMCVALGSAVQGTSCENVCVSNIPENLAGRKGGE